MAVFHESEDFVTLRAGGRVLQAALAAVVKAVRVGVTTAALDEIAEAALRSGGGTPAFLGYHGFPKTLCTSINDEVVHGIPTAERRLVAGDVVGLDLGVTYQGLILDMAITVAVPPIAPAAGQLLLTARRALAAGVRAVKAGATTGDIGAAIQTVVDGAGLGIVRELVGHGVGRELHEPPSIPNRGRPHAGVRLVAGQTIAIEPMITAGDWRVTVDADGWTVRTADRSLAAHFEQTVLVTDRGHEILTPYGRDFGD